MARESGRGRADGAVDPTLAQKKRARHRLVGAIALCLLAALLIPLILEAEPRQKPREVPLEIAAHARPVPPRSAAPTGAVGADGAGAPAGVAGTAPRSATEARSLVRPVESGASGHGTADGGGAGKSPASGSDGAAAPSPSRDRVPADRPLDRAAEKAGPERQSGDRHAAERLAAEKAAGERAAAERRAAEKSATDRAAVHGKLADARPSPRPDGDPLASIISRTDPAQEAGAPRKDVARRYLVQIGAYSSIESARAVTNRVFSSGLRPYQETVRTDKGEWIRVRVGPFENREAAEQALRNLKAAGVSAALMTL